MTKETSAEIATLAGKVMGWTEGDVMDRRPIENLETLKTLAASCLSQREVPDDQEIPRANGQKDFKAGNVTLSLVDIEAPDGGLTVQISIDRGAGYGQILLTSENGFAKELDRIFFHQGMEPVLELTADQEIPLSDNDVKLLDMGNELDDELETPATLNPVDVVNAQIHGEPIATGPRPTQPLFSKRKAFTDELTSLINRHSLETYSGTPDFILAQTLANALWDFGRAMAERDRWKAPAETEANFGLYVDGWLLNGTDVVGEIQITPPADVEDAHPFILKSSSLTAFLERRLG